MLFLDNLIISVYICFVKVLYIILSGKLCDIIIGRRTTVVIGKTMGESMLFGKKKGYRCV